VLGFPSVLASAISKGFLRSIAPWAALRGARSRGESCAKAVIAIVIATAEAMVREIRRTFRFLQFKRDSPLCQKWVATVQRHSVPRCPPTLWFAWGFGKLRGLHPIEEFSRDIFLELWEYFADATAFNIKLSGHTIPRLQRIDV